KSAQIREILISESAWEEMTCLFAPSLAGVLQYIEWKQHYALYDRVSRKELEVLYTHDNC
ncbi:hypothetical protein A3465_05950, partial [Enterobacter roggenkampii]